MAKQISLHLLPYKQHNLNFNVMTKNIEKSKHLLQTVPAVVAMDAMKMAPQKA